MQSIKSAYTMSDPGAQSPYREEILNSWTIKTDPRKAAVFAAPNAPEYGVYGQDFSVAYTTIHSIYSFLSDSFSGRYQKGGSLLNGFDKTHTTGVWPDEVMLALWTNNFTGCAYPENRISCGLDLVSKAMSKTFRDWPYSVNGTQGTQGDAYSQVIHIRVSWVWIALPACTWLLALVTFIATAWRSNALGMHVWRNSTLPMIFIDVEDETEAEQNKDFELKSLYRRARATKGKLKVDSEGIKFAT
jgi:hypothetical protein